MKIYTRVGLPIFFMVVIFIALSVFSLPKAEAAFCVTNESWTPAVGPWHHDGGTEFTLNTVNSCTGPDCPAEGSDRNTQSCTTGPQNGDTCWASVRAATFETPNGFDPPSCNFGLTSYISPPNRIDATAPVCGSWSGTGTSADPFLMSVGTDSQSGIASYDPGNRTCIGGGQCTVNILDNVGNKVACDSPPPEVAPECNTSASPVVIDSATGKATANFTATKGDGNYRWSAADQDANPQTFSGSQYTVSYTTAGTKTVGVTSSGLKGACTVEVQPAASGPANPTCTVDKTGIVAGDSVTFSTNLVCNRSNRTSYGWTVPSGTPNVGSGSNTFMTTFASAGKQTGNGVQCGNQIVSCPDVNVAPTGGPRPDNSATINVISRDSLGNPLATTWSMTGAETASQAPPETSHTYSSAPVGTYTMIANSLTGYSAPIITPADSQPVSSNGFITFTITYAAQNNPPATCPAVLSVSPANQNVFVDGTAAFAASYNPERNQNANGSCPDMSQLVSPAASWQASNATVALSLNGGSFKGLKIGVTAVTASFAGLTANANLTVIAVPPTGCTGSNCHLKCVSNACTSVAGAGSNEDGCSSAGAGCTVPPGGGCTGSNCPPSGGGGLSATLTPNPASGVAPLTVQLKTDVSGGSGTINYTYWWNCSYTGANVSIASDAAHCGAPNDKHDAVSATTFTALTTYPTEGAYNPKVIVERGSGSVNAAATVTVTKGVGGCSGSNCPGGGTAACTSFTASPTILKKGDSTFLSWSCSGVTACAVSDSNNAAVASGGPAMNKVRVTPAKSTQYVLRCDGAGASTPVSVYVVQTFKEVPPGGH